MKVLLILLLLAIAQVSGQSAIAVLQPTSLGPSGASGSVIFTLASGGGLNVQVSISGLVLNSVHGIHIHTYGDLTSPTGSSLGDHYNPYGFPHACPNVPKRHVGDLGNVTADENGNVTVTIYNNLVGLDPNNASSFIIGRGLILHANPDDCVTQPAGNAGARYLMGTIGYQSQTIYIYPTSNQNPASNMVATALIQPTTENTVSGYAIFTVDPNGGVDIALNISGLAANSTHGIHIHEFGDLTGNTGLTAGGHFNPFNQPHACPGTINRHVGDLGNFIADGNGNIIASFYNSLASLAVTNNASIIGRAIVVHADPDDCVTQPTGNAGARLALGVIGIATPTPLSTPTPTSTPTNPVYSTQSPTNSPKNQDLLLAAIRILNLNYAWCANVNNMNGFEQYLREDLANILSIPVADIIVSGISQGSVYTNLTIITSNPDSTLSALQTYITGSNPTFPIINSKLPAAAFEGGQTGTAMADSTYFWGVIVPVQKHLTGGQIAGAVFGTLIGVGLLIGLVVFYFKKRMPKKIKRFNPIGGDDDDL